MKTPFNYQLDGISFLAEKGGTLLADDPGVGKTLQSIEAWKRLRDDKPSIVFCPATVAGVWAMEIEEQAPGSRVLHLKSTKLKRLEDGWDWIVCSVDLPGRSEKVHAALNALNFRVMVVDEAHFLKNRSAKRTKALITGRERVAKRADFVWYLTGTPTPNHVGELWPLIVSTEPDRAHRLRYPDYENRYCTHKMQKRPSGSRGPREVRVVAGNNNATVPELVSRLDGWWLRRRKVDVLPELPDKFRRVVPLSVSKLDKELTELLNSKEGARLKEALGRRSADVNLADDESLARLLRLFALTKATAAAEYVQHILEDEAAPGVVCWFWHSEAMDRFQEKLASLGIDTVRIDGSTPNGQRAGIVQRFQSADGPKVFIGQIKAAGTGITLTKATRAVFVECRTTPGDNVQAEDRIFRIGQKSNVQIDYLAVHDSIDEVWLDIAAKRTADWERIEQGALSS